MASRYAAVKAWRKENPEKVAAQARRYRARHPEVVAATKRRYRERNLERVREGDRMRVAADRRADPVAQQQRVQAYRERQELARVAQAGRPRPDYCELCGAKARTVFDHCHQSGQFRGWLCDRCNRVLGSCKDDPVLLRALADYVEEHSGETVSEGP